MPLVSFLDFPDSHKFGGLSILSDVSALDENDPRLLSMEKFAKTALTLFHPFRKAHEHLTFDGKHLPKFQTLFASGDLDKHKHHFVNAQESHDSFSCGRPDDVLESNTHFPKCVLDDSNLSDFDADTRELDETYAKNMHIFHRKKNFHDEKDKLKVQSSIIIDAGSHKCGRSFINPPNVSSCDAITTQEPTNENTSTDSLTVETTMNNLLKPNSLPRQHLHKILTTRHDVLTTNHGQVNWEQFVFTGSLENISHYADLCFNGDDDQEVAFTQTVSAFVLKLHEKSTFCKGKGEKQSIDQTQKLQSLLNDPKQFVCFLSGQGGSGKSRVIGAVIHYCKNLCQALNVEFSRFTIVVTAMTGAAAVNINGQTVHRACKLNNSNIEKSDEWANETCMVIVDEISFCSQDELTKISANLNLLCDKPPESLFGDLPMLFAGDFSQLPPVEGKSLLARDFSLWREGINTFLELRTNHRFKHDPDWGLLLQSMRDEGLTMEQVDFVNRRVVSENSNIPNDVSYATHTNKDKSAINEGIFLQHLKRTHSKNINDQPPFHTIVVMASNLKFHIQKGRYDDMPDLQRNIILTQCSDADISSTNSSKRIDPMLKFFIGRPLMINDNINVENKIANGSMATFRKVSLTNGLSDCFVINIDGFYVNCVEAINVNHIEVMLEGDACASNIRRIKISKSTAIAKFLDCEDPMNDFIPEKISARIQLHQFPLNIANARTVHKLQGTSLQNLFVSNWSYGPNWAYVVLSRVRTSNGLFLRLPLDHKKLNSDNTIDLKNKTKAFLQHFRDNKSPMANRNV